MADMKKVYDDLIIINLYVQWDKSKNHVSEEALYVFETFQKLCHDSIGENKHLQKDHAPSAQTKGL